MSTTWINRGHFYVPHVKPVLVDCNFKVLVGDSAGLGIAAGSLKGQGVSNVFMHTSATPGVGANGITNPNPLSGFIWVQLTDNFMKLYQMGHSFHSPLSGSNVLIDASDANLVAGTPYVISVLGTSTAADWLAIGVPAGVVPAVGVAFIATATGAGVGTGAVQVNAAAGAGVNHIEIVGNSQLAINPVPVGGSPHVGGWIMLCCYKDSAADANVAAAPADNTVIRLSFYLSQSSVVVSGE